MVDLGLTWLPGGAVREFYAALVESRARLAHRCGADEALDVGETSYSPLSSTFAG